MQLFRCAQGRVIPSMDSVLGGVREWGSQGSFHIHNGSIWTPPGPWQLMEELLQLQLTAYRILHDRKEESASLNNLGYLAEAQGQPYEQALAILTPMGHVAAQVALNNYARLKRSRRRFWPWERK